MTPQNTNEALSALITGVSGVSNAAVFGTASTSVGTLQTTRSGSTLTFSQPYEGLLFFAATGTTLVAPTVTAGTSTVTGVGYIINAAATSGNGAAIVRAQAGQTIVFDLSGSASVSAFTVRCANYTYANA